MISRGFRRRNLSLLSSLLVVLLSLTAFPKPAKADQATIDAELIARMRNVVAQLAPTDGTAWQQYLNKRFYIATKLDASGATLNWNTDNGVPAAWKWSGATATLDAPSSIGMPSSPLRKPYFDSTTRTYYVYSGEQLKYALEKCSDDYNPLLSPNPPTRTISIQTDIDLNGQAGKVWECVNSLHNVTILGSGNGHTVYNLRGDNSVESSTPDLYGALIGYCIGLTMAHLTFSNANICSEYTVPPYPVGNYQNACGIIGFPTTTTVSDITHIFDVTVKDSLFVGADQVGSLSGRTSTNITTDPNMTINNCYAENNICFGNQHVGSLCSSINNLYSAEYCYSVGSVVISTGGHSGGLFSCGAGNHHISDCFVDAEVYGNKQTGVFAGVMSGIDGNTGTLYSRCYASGFVEGTEAMGGFIGEFDASHVTFQDCYSTALVGLRSGATDTGAFLGRRTANGVVRNMMNCYAAGETGYTGLDCSVGSTVPGSSHIGGMIGSIAKIGAASNCYYDKQTTAMREWGVGQNSSTVSTANMVTGVMTTDGEEGMGLTSTSPGGTTGFRGFSSDAWDYNAIDHYPELKTFKSASAGSWGTDARADLVKAYSLSSTATMLLDTWDRGLNTSTGKIDVRGTMSALTYDTVRDITSSFTLTADLVDNWDRIGDQDSKTHGESTSVIAGETLNVLSLKAAGGQYICDELVPGIEWLMVTCSAGGQTATRRIRVIPTASLDAGLNAVITGLYDHADDVKLFYSTGARIEVDRSDVTTGIYPDKDGGSNALTSLQRTMLGNVKNTYNVADTEAANDYYYNQGYGAAASYMGRSGENADRSGIFVYIYKVTGIDENTGEISTGERIILDDTSLTARTTGGAGQFNGYELLENTDQRYLIEYMWQLKDGRVLSDAKMVRRAKLPFHVALNLYQNTISPATLYPEGGYLYTGINAVGGSRPPLTDFSNITTDGRQAATDTGEAKYKETAQTAWKLKNPADTVIQVQLIMQNGDPAIRSGEVFTKTIDNPTPGQTISLPTVRYRIVYRNGGFFTIPEQATRNYILQYHTASKTWHLEFAKSGEQSPENKEILFNDVENCIRVNVVVRRGAGPVDPDIPDTGDDTPLHLWLGIMLLSLVGFVIVRRRRASDDAQ